MYHLSNAFRPLVIVCLLAWAVPARAEVTYDFSNDELTVVRLTVTPAAEAVPALKYRFEPRAIDLKSGNAAPFYYRALAILEDSLFQLRKKYNEESELHPWYSTANAESLPVDKLPLDKVRDAVQMTTGGGVGDELAKAVSRSHCDWELGVEEARGVDVVAVLLGEFQQSRELTRMLSLRTRLDIAERRYEDAVDTLRTSFRVAQDFSKLPFIVSGLIGIAESMITAGNVTELIAAPGAPNLYWALSELPQPLVDLRPAIRYEMDFGPRIFPFLHDAEITDRAADEWNRLFVEAIGELGTLGGNDDVVVFSKDKIGRAVGATAYGLVGYSHAKQRLVEQGMDPAKVEAMSVGQVMAIYTERLYKQLANESEKLWYIPYWEMQSRRYSESDALRAAHPFGTSPDREILPIVNLLLPAMQAARSAQVRLDRDIAALRVIEAIRMYAAAHNGRLPASLDAITQVPIPLNPVTGKPFVYYLEGDTGVLELPKSDGIPGYNRRYEIKIAPNPI